MNVEDLSQLEVMNTSRPWQPINLHDRNGFRYSSIRSEHIQSFLGVLQFRTKEANIKYIAQKFDFIV